MTHLTDLAIFNNFNFHVNVWFSRLLIISTLWRRNPGGGAVPFGRWRVCKAQKTPFFSIAVTHRPHIFYSCVSSHPKTHIFSFNLSLNAPWFEKLAFEKNTMYFTLVILQSSIEKTFGSHPMTPHIFVFFSHWMPKIMLSPNDPSFFEPVLSPNAPACWRAGLTPVSTSYLTAPPGRRKVWY